MYNMKMYNKLYIINQNLKRKMIYLIIDIPSIYKKSKNLTPLCKTSISILKAPILKKLTIAL